VPVCYCVASAILKLTGEDQESAVAALPVILTPITLSTTVGTPLLKYIGSVSLPTL